MFLFSPEDAARLTAKILREVPDAFGEEDGETGRFRQAVFDVSGAGGSAYYAFRDKVDRDELMALKRIDAEADAIRYGGS